MLIFLIQMGMSSCTGVLALVSFFDFVVMCKFCSLVLCDFPWGIELCDELHDISFVQYGPTSMVVVEHFFGSLVHEPQCWALDCLKPFRIDSICNVGA